MARMLSLLREVYERVRRLDCAAPGWSHLEMPAGLSSHDLRTVMITIGDHLIARFRDDLGMTMEYLSLGRVDQKLSTRIHLDGGPPHSILVLGYEPSLIRSQVAVVDYARHCRDRGIAISDFLARFDQRSADLGDFAGYVTRLPEFASDRANVVVVNNSSSACGEVGLCGLMHVACVEAGSGARVINTLTLGEAAATASHALDETAKQRFVEVTGVDVAYDG